MTRSPRSTVGIAQPGALPPYEAVIFCLDAMVAGTAALDASAWTSLFHEVVADPRAADQGTRTTDQAFDDQVDHSQHLDVGGPPENVIRAFVTARGIEIPPGVPGDSPRAWTLHGLAGRHNQIFLELASARGAHSLPGTMDLLRRLHAGHVPIALVTASHSADAFLLSAGLQGLFDVVVDGREATGGHLPGMPDPATFLAAARTLGVDPGRTAVVADAAAGVTAACRGGFGLVAGLARDGRRALLAAGAQVVVEDLAQLDLGALRIDPWMLIYEGFDPAHEGHREALTTLANGYLGTRGASPECSADGVHYPGTYLAGVYNRVTSLLDGRRREDEHLVNLPNWLTVDIRVGDGPWWSSGGLAVVSEQRELDLRRAVLTRYATVTDPEGRRLLVTQRRLVSMGRPHLAALQTTLVAVGWSGSVRVRAAIDADVVNGNVADDAALANHHLRLVNTRSEVGGRLLVEVETNQSHIRIATASRLKVTTPGDGPVRVTQPREARCSHVMDLVLTEGQPVTIDKTIAVFTSRDPAIASPGLAAWGELDSAPMGWVDLLPDHVEAWADLWRRFGVDLHTDVQTQLVLNLHVFHLLQSLSEHTSGLDAGVPARGLHGEGYRGHVFWDELFVLPVLTAHQPQVSRGLLDYRYRRLDAARRAATAQGCAGAMFPWQSGSDGREETPSMLFNARSGRWMPDNSWRQRHVGLAVAYNAWQFYQATGDRAWLAQRGADLIIEVARYIASLASYDRDDDRFHIEGVMGPDEYHDGYPDAPGRGLRDNAYTNVLAAWVCQRAGEVLSEVAGYDCDRVGSRLRIRAEERNRWDHLGRRLAVPFHEGVISQFAGYESLRELDWDRYRAAYGNIGRLDLILEAEGDSTNRYRLAKQADVLMLVYLFGLSGLRTELARLGYVISEELVGRTVDYYLARTANGSTLSQVVHASVLARLDPERAWESFQGALTADLDDTQGGTTGHGVHLGAMAATIDIVTRAFAGITAVGDAVLLDPRMPVGLREARFELMHRGQRLRVALKPTMTDAIPDPCAANPAIRVTVMRTGARARGTG